MGGEAYDWLLREKLLPTFSRAFNDNKRSLPMTRTFKGYENSSNKQARYRILHQNLYRYLEDIKMTKFNIVDDGYSAELVHGAK